MSPLDYGPDDARGMACSKSGIALSNRHTRFLPQVSIIVQAREDSNFG